MAKVQCFINTKDGGRINKKARHFECLAFLFVVFVCYFSHCLLYYFWHCAKVTKTLVLCLKTLKDSNKSYSALNSGKRTTLQSFSTCPQILYSVIGQCNLAKNRCLTDLLLSFFFAFLRQGTEAIRISRAFLRRALEIAYARQSLSKLNSALAYSQLFSKVIKIVITFEKVIKTFFVFLLLL